MLKQMPQFTPTLCLSLTPKARLVNLLLRAQAVSCALFRSLYRVLISTINDIYSFSLIIVIGNNIAGINKVERSQSKSFTKYIYGSAFATERMWPCLQRAALAASNWAVALFNLGKIERSSLPLYATNNILEYV